jgi:hypothetical protein
MKTKKRVFSFILAMVVAFAVIITPKFDTNAATYISAPSNVFQVSASGNTLTVGWTAVSGAVQYNYVVRVGGSTGAVALTGAVATNGLKLTGVRAGVNYYVSVASVAADGTTSYYTYGTRVYAIPDSPKNIYLDTWTPDSNNPYIKWTGYNSSLSGAYYPDGYQVKITSLGGKNVGTYTVSSESLYKNLPRIKNAGFKIKIRTYKTINTYNGQKKKLYSKWSKVKTFVPQPKMGGHYSTRDSKGELSWKGVKNAKSYTVYKVTQTTNSYKLTKIKTVPGSVNKIPVPRHAKYTVIATVKAGSKTIKGTNKDRRYISVVTFN